MIEAGYKYIIPNSATTIRYGQRSLNLFGKVHYAKIVLKAYYDIWTFYRKALRDKECYYGPFKGEFGHLLLHTTPFLMHLHKQGVKIHFCGTVIAEPFLIDESGNSILYEFHKLRDFYGEVLPCNNETVPPKDVQEEIDRFTKKAIESKKAFLNIADHDMYWFVYRNWQLKGRQHMYHLEKFYQTAKENSCVIFPRFKKNTEPINNGELWDYMEIARMVAPFFDKVYMTGHPNMSAALQPEGNIEICVSSDNRKVLETCSNANLIITQHSGAVHMGSYTNCKVLLIYNGNPPIGGLADTLRYRANFSDKPISFAFTMDEIRDFITNYSKKHD